MADWARNAEFRRNLQQLRDLRNQGYAFESVPLGGDALSRGSPIQSFQAEMKLAAFERREARFEKELKTVRSDVTGLKSALRTIGGRPQTLTDKIRGEGFGLKFSKGGLRAGPVQIGKGGFKLNMPKMTGGTLVTYALMQLGDAGLNAILDAKDKYDSLKKEGRTEQEARRAMYGQVGENVANSTIDVLGSAPFVGSAQRLIKVNPEKAKHMWARMFSRYLNQSELIRQEQARGNAELAVHQNIDVKFDKLAATGPHTFRLKSAKDVQIYANDKRRALELVRQGAHSNRHAELAQGRVVAGG